MVTPVSKKIKYISMLCYLSGFVLISSFLKGKAESKRDKTFLEFHIKEGIRLFIVQMVFYFIALFIDRVVVNLVPLSVFVGMGYAVAVIYILLMALSIKGLLNVFDEEKKYIPILSLFNKDRKRDKVSK